MTADDPYDPRLHRRSPGCDVPGNWLLMLFLGNVGLLQSYWGTLPLGILVSVLLGGVTAPKYDVT